MAYLGTKPANSPLTSELIPDGLINTSDLANGAVTQDKLSTLIAPKGTPAFSAYLSGNQSISHNTVTKVTFQLEEFDTSSSYDTSTYKFQPNVAGYYQITSHLFYNLGVTSIVIINFLYKNGSVIKSLYGGGTNGSGYFVNELNALVYMNGTTDYIEVYTQQNSGSSQNLGSGGGAGNTWFSGVLVRAA